MRCFHTGPRTLRAVGVELKKLFSRRLRVNRRLGWLGSEAAAAMQDVAAALTAGMARVRDSHLLTLATPEFLEQRRFMDVGAAQNGTTLHVWIDERGIDQSAYIENTALGLAVSTDSCMSIPGRSNVVPGPGFPTWTGINSINVYKSPILNGTSAGGSYSITSPGSGYITAPTVTITGGVPLANLAVTGAASSLNVTSATISNPGSGLTPGTYTRSLTGGVGGTGATGNITVGADGTVTAISITANGSGYTSLSGITVAGVPITGVGTQPQFSFTGGVDSITSTNGTGYFSSPTISFSASPTGNTAQATASLSNVANFTASFSTTSISSAFSQNLALGVSNAAPNNIQVESGITGNLSVQPFRIGLNTFLFAQNVTVSGAINTPTAYPYVFAKGDVRILGNVRSQGLYLSGFGNVALTGTDINISTDTQLYAGSGSIGVSRVLSGTFTAQSSGTLTATGAIVAANGVRMFSDAAGIVLGSGGVSATNGEVVLSAQNTANGTIAGNTTVTAIGLTIREGRASAAPYTITGNVSSLTADLASDVTFVNSRSLTVGAGNLTTSGTNLTIQTQESGRDLSVIAPITSLNANGTNVALIAGGNVGVSSELTTNNGSLSIRAGGNIVAGARLNASTNTLSFDAGTGVDGGTNLFASSVKANTAVGDINFASATSAPLNIAQATTGSGNVSLQSLQGNLAVIGPISTANGNVTISTGSAAQTLSLNGAISTPANGTVFLSALNVTGGTISNGTGFGLNTGTLNFTAANAPAFLNSGAASFGNFSAALLGLNNTLLDVVVNSSLNVTSISTLNSPVAINVVNGDLSLRTVQTGTATSPQNITLAASNGSVTTLSTLTANVLNVTANSTSSLSTNATTLIAAITGAGQNLTITEASHLQVGTSNTTNVTANGGAINIQLAGNLTGPGFINAAGTGGLGNVTLGSSAGNISLGSQVTANVLSITANSTSSLSTNATTLIAAITGAGQNLTITEASHLQVGTSNTTNVTANGGAINIQLAGNLTGPGFINAAGAAGIGNVTLGSSAGNISLGSQVTANVLSITANSTSSLSTNATTLIAAITGAGQNLTITEATDLQVGTSNTTNVTANGGAINIQLAGNLTGPGFINAAGAAGIGNVTLGSSAGNISLGSQVTANVLSITANSTSSLSTNATTLIAAITGAGQNLTITEATDLQVGTSNTTNVTANGGAINIQLAGNLTGPGFINAAGTGGLGNVTLGSSAGNISLGSQVTANVLSITANSTSSLSTNATTLIAAITGAGQNLTITEASHLQVGTSNTTNVTANGGAINIQLAGNLTGPGFINAAGAAGIGNVTLGSSAGNISLGSQVTANVLSITANSTSSLSTNATTLIAAITGAGQNLTITEATDLQVGTSNTTNVTANGGAINIQLAGNLTGPGFINANGTGGLGNVTLNSSAGNVSLGNQVTANVLNITANSTSSLSTDAATLIAAITGAGQNLTITEANDLQGNITASALSITANGNASLNTNVNNLAANITSGGLTVTETNGLTIDPQNVTTNGSGNISISVLNGNLSRTGAMNAGLQKVTLNVPNGSINGTGTITGNWLDWTAQTQIDSANTSFSMLSANVTGTGNLVIDHAASLTVVNAVTNSGTITFNANAAAPTNLTINGTIQAGTAAANQVTLNVTNGSIITTAGGVIIGSLLNVTARNTSSLNTNVNNLAANITSGGLTVTETNGLTIDPQNVTTNGSGNISISVLNGNLSRTGAMNAGLQKVTLNVPNGSINGTGTITGNWLDWTAQTQIDSANTSFSMLSANVTGTGNLVIDHAASLTVVNAVTNSGTITFNANAAAPTNLTINGTIQAGTAAANQVTLNVTNGSIITTAGGVIIGSLLNVTARNTSSLNTNVNNLAANITSGGLTVTEANALAIDAADVVAAGPISITAGSLSSTAGAEINAGAGNNVILTATGGAATLAGLVTGNLLNVSATAASSLNTNVNNLAANITSGGLTVTEANALAIDAADVVAAGPISISAGSLSSAAGAEINAGAANNVILTATGGAATLAGLITGNLLNVSATAASTLNTNVASLAANVTGGGLTVTEANALEIDAADVVAAGPISISATSLTSAAGAEINAGPGNVRLNATSGAASLAGLVTGNLLNVSATAASSLNTNVASLAANVTGGGLTVTEANALAIDAADVVAAGPISITAGSLSSTAGAEINAGAGNNVVLIASGGAASLTGLVTGNLLNVSATAASSLNTNVASLTANITGGGLTVTEANALAIDAADVVAAGPISITAGSLSSTAGAEINAGAGNNVILTATGGAATLAGLVTGNLLNVSATAASSLNTNVNNLAANITSGGLTVTEANALAIDAADVVAAGPISISAGSLSSAAGAEINAGAANNVILTATGGAATLAGLITGNLLNVSATAASTLNTNVASLAANVTGGGLTVTEANALEIDAADVVAAGPISISATSLTSAAGAEINAGPGNVRLNATSGAASLAGLVTGNLLNVSATAASSLNTNVASLAANVTGGGLTVTEANALAIDAADVVAAGPISITAGSLSSTAGAEINAGAGNNVVLIASGGAASLTGLVTGNLLNVSATAASSLNTNVASLTANITGGGLTVTEANALAIDAADVVAAGPISITAGSLSSTAGAEINAGAGNNVILTATGGAATLAGLVTGNLLNVSATAASSLNTNVNNLAANITSGGLTVTEANALAIDAADVVAAGPISISAGSLSSAAGAEINAGAANNVILTATGGAATLAGLITGNLLNVSATAASTLNTNVASLAANVTGGGLTVTEANALEIDAADVVAAGPISISATSLTSAAGAEINAGVANNVVLAATSGAITAGGRIRGNRLDVTAVSGISVLTAVTTIRSQVTSSGDISIEDEDDLIVGVGNTDYNGAVTANGFVRIKTPTSRTTTVNSIDAQTGLAGNVFIDTGSLFIYSPGIRASGTVDLQSVASSTVVQPGGQIDAGNGTILKPNDTLSWSVTNNNTSGPGSLAEVIADVNASGAPSTITIAGPQTIVLTDPAQALPEITTPLTLNGNGHLVIDGTGAGNASGLVVNGAAGGNGVRITGVTLRNFRDGAGLALIGTQNTVIAQVTVTNSAVGLRAAGALGGTRVTGSTFTGNREGVVLQDATGFRFGIANTAGNFNTISNSLSVGMSISGINGGTRVFGNRFVSNPTAIRLTAAKGSSRTEQLLIGETRNASSRNSIQNGRVGILATGFCTFAQVNNTVFVGRVTTRYQVSRSRGLRVLR